VTLLNQPLSFDTNTEDSILGGFIGYGMDYDLVESVTISGNYETQLSKEIFSQYFRLGLVAIF